MYLCRILLVITVLLAAYVAAMTAILVPYLWLAILAIVVVAACKKGYRYTAYGTARWADAADLPHLLEGSGVILGHIGGKNTKLAGVKALFNSRLSAKKDGSTYVPYGPGQNPGDKDHDQPLHGVSVEAMKPPEQEQSMGREM